jgi:hypothetical protein
MRFHLLLTFSTSRKVHRKFFKASIIFFASAFYYFYLVYTFFKEIEHILMDKVLYVHLFVLILKQKITAISSKILQQIGFNRDILPQYLEIFRYANPLFLFINMEVIYLIAKPKPI